MQNLDLSPPSGTRDFFAEDVKLREKVFDIFTSQSKSAIASGGRYDKLVGMFSKKDVPACGGSLGIERILALLRETEQPTMSIPRELA